MSLPPGIAAAWLDAARSAAGTATLRCLFIAIAAWAARAVVTRLIRAFRLRLAARMTDPEHVRRAETLGRALRYLASAAILLVAGVLMLDQAGVSVAPLLGAAGVAGLAIGFGAQSLVKDYFTGFFLLLENQLVRGDVVQVADKSGVVEDLTFRYVQLRDYDGHVHFIPNGLVTTVTNMSRGYAYAVVDIGIAYREDIDEAVACIRRVAKELADDPQFRERILDAFEIAGVERWEASAVVIRGRFKVKPLQQWDVRRAFLRRLKRAFDEAGIEIPFPHVTVYAGAGKDGSAPAFQLNARTEGR